MLIPLKVPKKAAAFTPTPIGYAHVKSQLVWGFTLIELIIVVVIIGILAAITLPNYAKAKEKALAKEAIANLRLIIAAEKIYKVEQGAYVVCSCSSTSNCEKTTSGCNYLLKLDLNPGNWLYSTNISGGGSSITACASRNSSSCLYCLDVEDNLTSYACP